MDLSKLDKILKDEKKYRAQQVKRAVFKNLIKDWSEATSLAVILREKLTQECPLEIDARVFISKDGQAIKALIKLKDGLAIESVLMRYKEGRNAICASTQVGCPLGCVFCATGKMGFKRNLDAGEIVEQILFFARYLKERGETIKNVVLMGMGEPFLNYDNVLLATRIINDKDGLNLGIRHISISTAGLTEGIRKLAEENLAVNLAISFHAPDDELRARLMPIGKQYPIEKILSAVDEYIEKTGRKVMFEYVLIKGVNDSDADAKKLAKLMKKKLYMVNLIAYNSTNDFSQSSPERTARFKEILENEGVSVTERHSFGTDIFAACGQLAVSGVVKL
ncbi:MAG: 23S rRNA (adenine(2503)-C(2))-methyltransferase RlmN [Patescibacteria group bacterium]|nr:23S rRNA (adenine(2503)-C(2))-methyltransferase RlmN [Patescibacteria group bacterium]